MKKFRSPVTPLISILTTFVAFGCSSDRGSPSSQNSASTQAPQATPPKDIENSFGTGKKPNEKLHAPVSAPSPQPGNNLVQPRDNVFIEIKKAALGKEFLLEGSKITQQGSPTGHSTQSRIVTFKKVLDKVYLLEATQGHVVTGDLPASRLLAEIPVISESDESLIIDFNQGMRQAFSQPGAHLSDSFGKDYRSNLQQDVIQASYIDSAFMRNNFLEIRQIAQVREEAEAKTYEYRYYISPYLPNPAFTPKETTDFRRMGFFEVAPLLQEGTGKTVTYIRKFDISRPIVFHISANTPPDYIEAVKDGIRYWNRAFGREVLRAELAPAGVIAPDPAYNLVQWVPNDSASTIYADAHADPRTGEVLHAQIYLSSSFATGSRKGAALILERIRTKNNRNPGKSTQNNDMAFLSSGNLCDLAASDQAAEAFARDLENLVAQKAEDGAFLKASQNHIRSSVAHEIGHTLGLRHNFAGSLGGSYSRPEKIRAFHDYLTQGTIPKTGSFGTTVMDYQVLSEDILLATQAFDRNQLLPYDQATIRWAYFNEEPDPTAVQYFCSDEQLDKYIDCKTFDRGSMPIISNAEEMEATVEELPAKALATYYLAKNSPDEQKRVEAVALSSADFIDDLASAVITPQMKWFMPQELSSLLIESRFPFVGEFNKDEIQAARILEVNRELGVLGGVDRALFSLLPSVERPDSSIARDAIATFKRQLSSGGDYANSFTPAEIAVMTKNSTRAFEITENNLILANLDALLSIAKYADGLPYAEIQKRLGSAATALLLTQPNPSVAGIQTTFRYSQEVRAKAALLLADRPGLEQGWAAGYRKDISARFKALLPSGNTFEERQWLLKQNEILNLL